MRMIVVDGGNGAEGYLRKGADAKECAETEFISEEVLRIVYDDVSGCNSR